MLLSISSPITCPRSNFLRPLCSRHEAQSEERKLQGAGPLPPISTVGHDGQSLQTSAPSQCPHLPCLQAAQPCSSVHASPTQGSHRSPSQGQDPKQKGSVHGGRGEPQAVPGKCGGLGQKRPGCIGSADLGVIQKAAWQLQRAACGLGSPQGQPQLRCGSTWGRQS